MQENEQLKALKASKTPHPAPQPEAPTEAPKPKRWKLGEVPPPGTRVSVRMPASTLSRRRDRTQVQHHEGTVGDAEAPTATARTSLGRALAMVKFDDGSERPIDFAVPGISITREASQSAPPGRVVHAVRRGEAPVVPGAKYYDREVFMAGKWCPPLAQNQQHAEPRPGERVVLWCLYDPDANEAKPWRVQWKEGGERMGTRKGRDDVRVKA